MQDSPSGWDVLRQSLYVFLICYVFGYGLGLVLRYFLVGGS